MILCKKDDEDKGSSLQNEVNLSGFRYVASQLLNPQTGKIESSAEALRVCHHPLTFPSKDNYAHNTTRAIARSKGKDWQKR